MEKYTLITGASSGIGYHLAKIFAQNGHNLILVSRSKAELDKCALQLSNYKVKIEVMPKDLFEKNAAFDLYAEVKQKGFEVDILVNDAGQGLYGEFLETDIERELKIIQLNICSLVVLTKCFIKDMAVKGEGKILNVASVASKLPGPYQSVYHATKAFVHSFTEAIRNEIQDKNIVITSLLPGVTATDFFKKADMLNSKAVQNTDDMADPADVANDGYNALMAGKDMVISGTMNKIQLGLSNVTPDSLVAEQVKKKQEPVNKK